VSSVRRFFGACGDVLKVELLTERGGSSTSSAYVTMATAAGATVAVDTLHGRLHLDRTVMVSITPTGKHDRGASASTAVSTRVALAQQYRDARCMTYELEWSGRRLTLQFFFPHEDGACRVQARTGLDGTGVVEATDRTRERALTAVATAWQASSQLPVGEIPWDEVVVALKSVRAI
jgi:hypothetical protein